MLTSTLCCIDSFFVQDVINTRPTFVHIFSHILNIHLITTFLILYSFTVIPVFDIFCTFLVFLTGVSTCDGRTHPRCFTKANNPEHSQKGKKQLTKQWTSAQICKWLSLRLVFFFNAIRKLTQYLHSHVYTYYILITNVQSQIQQQRRWLGKAQGLLHDTKKGGHAQQVHS